MLRKILHESHNLARCSKWAHVHFSSACASMQTRQRVPYSLRSTNEGASGPFSRVLDVLVVVEVLESLRSASEGAFAGLMPLTFLAVQARASIHGAVGHRAVVRSCVSRSSRKIAKHPPGIPAPQGAYLFFIAYLFLTYLGL